MGERRAMWGRGERCGEEESDVGGRRAMMCGSYWDSNDARVVCRQLGFRSGRNISLGNGYFSIYFYLHSL